MPGPLSIDYAPLDFSGAEQIPLLYQAARKSAAQEAVLRQNAETQRMYAANQDRKLSADLAREAWEQKHKVEREQHADEIATSTALPTIMRIAARDPGLAGAMGKPYGVTIGQQDVKQMPEDTGPSSAEVAQFLSSGGVPRSEDPTFAGGHGGALQGPTETGPSLGGADPRPVPNAAQPLQGPTPSGAPLSEQDRSMPWESAEPWASQAPTAPTPGPAQFPELDADATATAKEKVLPTTRSYYAESRGQRFPVQAHEEKPFGEPEYDDMYQRLLAENPDVPPLKLRAEVAKVRAQNLGATGRSDALEETKRYHTGELGLGGRRIEQSDTNSRRAAWAGIEEAKIRAAAMAGGGGPGGLPDPKLLNAYYGQSNRAFARSGAKIDQAGQRLHDRIAAELDKSDANPYAVQSEIHSLAAASVMTGTSAGRVLKSVIEDFQNALPLWDQVTNTIHRKTLGGNTPEVQAKLHEIADLFRRVGHEQARQDFRSWSSSAGPASVFGRDARTRDSTFDESKSVAQGLGLSEPEALELLGLGDGGEPLAPGPAAPAQPSPRAAPHQRRPAQPVPAAPATPAPPAGLPPGAIPGRQKSTGKRGYMLNGVFHATE